MVEVTTQTVETPSTEVLDRNSPTPAVLPPTVSPISPTALASITAFDNNIATEFQPTTAPGSDPDLKPGFPVVMSPASRYFNMVIGNINADPSEEIVVITVKAGTRQLLALGPDGKPVGSWPTGAGAGSYPDLALGEFLKVSPGLEVVSYLANERAGQRSGGEWEFGVSIYTGAGDILPSWPITQPFTGPFGLSAPISGVMPPMVLDLDKDGNEEVFALHSLFRADG
jgi:hypothetical protein